MFTELLRLISGRPPPGSAADFVKEVRVVRGRPPRSRRTERLILAGWVLIAAKSWLMIWLVEKYHVPINASWVIVPTLVFAGLCTALYFWRD